MAKLKLGAIADDKPVKLTFELPANVHRDLLAYAQALARETGQPIARAHVVDDFIADKNFAFADVLQACNCAQKRALATAGRADQDSEVAICDI